MVDEKSKKKALAYCHGCHNMAKTLRKYPLCSRSAFQTWLKNEGKERVRSGRPGVLPPAGYATPEQKFEILTRALEGHEPVLDVAIETGYSRPTMCKWKRQYQADGMIGLMEKRKHKGETPSADSRDLLKRLDEMQLQIDILKETIKA